MKGILTSKTSSRWSAYLALSLSAILMIGLVNQAVAQSPTWLPAAHRFKDVYDEKAVGNRGLQYQMVVAWNQGTSDPTKLGWIVTGQDENGVRLSTDYGATWTTPRLAGMFCSRMAGLYFNTDDDLFVAVGDAFGNTSSIAGYAGLYVGDSSLMSARRVVAMRDGDEGFTKVMNGAQANRNLNCIGRRPQTGGLTVAQRPIVVIEQERTNLTSDVISAIYVWISENNGADWSMVRKLAPVTGTPITDYTDGGRNGIAHVMVAPNGDVLLVGQTGAFLSQDLFATAPAKMYPVAGNKIVTSGYFFGGTATTPSGARIGIGEASPGGVLETADIRTTALTKPNNNAGLPANYRVVHLGGSPVNPDRLAVCTMGPGNNASYAPYFSVDGGRNFTQVNDIKGTGDEQWIYDVRAFLSGGSSHGHAGFYFCPTDENKCLTPTCQTVARSIDGAETTNGDLVAGFDGMHAKGFGYHRTDYKQMARQTTDSGANVSRDGMHWVRPAGWNNGTAYDVNGNGTIEAGETFGAAITAAGGGNASNGLTGAGVVFGTVNNRIVGFFNRNGAGQPNIPVVMDDPDGDGSFQDILIKAYSPTKPSRAPYGKSSPKDATVAFVGRWAISSLDAASQSGVNFADRYQGSAPREFIDCFLEGSTLVSYWGNFKNGSGATEANGSEIYRSTADLGDNNQSTPWYTIPNGQRYPVMAICVDHHAAERVLYVRTDNLHVIREVKRVGNDLVDEELVNLRTMAGGLEATVRAEVGDPNLPIPAMPIQQIFCDPNKAGVFYAIVGRHGVPNWWRTVDNGATWDNISNNAPRTLWWGAVHPLTGDVLGFSSMGEHVHKSPVVSGYPTLTNRDALSDQIIAYMALRPNITTTSLPGAYVDSPYHQTLAATGGSGAKVWSVIAGALPAGLSLSAGGVISGTPTAVVTKTFDVKVADSDSVDGLIDEDIQTLTIAVTGVPPAIVQSPADRSVNPGDTTTFSVTASGYPAPHFQWQISSDGGMTWNDFGNNSTYSGVNGATLTIASVTVALDGTRYRCVATNDFAPSATSAAATLTVLTGPVFAQSPLSQTATLGSTVILSGKITNAGAVTYQWRFNGMDIPGATLPEYPLINVQPENVGSYALVATNSMGSAISSSAIVGITTSTKVEGGAYEYAANIVHPNGNVYDQILMTGRSATVTADPGQILRISFIDLNDDIVQLEFSGAGSLTVNLENASGPSLPVNYNQAVPYMKGHAVVTIAGATESTYFGSYAVGKLHNANPALYKDDVTYDGVVGIALLNLASGSGAFGGLGMGNVEFFSGNGLTGVNAPGVRILGSLNVHNITADHMARPVLLSGPVDAGEIKICGGDLLQLNGSGIEFGAAQRVAMVAGTDSHGRLQPAQKNLGRLFRNGLDVTSEVVVSP